MSQNTSKSRRFQRKVTEELKNKKDNHKLSLTSKVIVWLCLLAFIWITLVSLSNATLAESLRYPKTFFTERLFKSDTRNMTSTTKKEAVVKTSSSSEKKTSQAKKTTRVSSDQKNTSSSSSTSNQNTYIVQAGDSLSIIAENHGYSVEEIQQVNPGVDFSVIHPGQEINLPEPTTSANSTTEQSDGANQ